MRCALCGERGRHERDGGWRDGGWRECTHCAMRYAPGHRPMAAIAGELQHRFAASTIDLLADPPPDWTGTAYTIRAAGYRFGRAVHPLPGGGARLEALPDQGPPIALGLLARPADLPLVRERIERLMPAFARVIVLLDDPGPPPPAHDDVRYDTHPLDGDFAQQRNRLHDLSDTPWMLQIDADEEPTPDLLAALPGLAADADRNGLRSLAFPRRNLVDGVAGDLWPDVQYRLNRTGERYVGHVHERPQAASDWSLSALAPVGVIIHRLDGDRVRARTRIYGAMAADGARIADEHALLRPFSPD